MRAVTDRTSFLLLAVSVLVRHERMVVAVPQQVQCAKVVSIPFLLASCACPCDLVEVDVFAEAQHLLLLSLLSSQLYQLLLLTLALSILLLVVYLSLLVVQDHFPKQTLLDQQVLPLLADAVADSAAWHAVDATPLADHAQLWQLWRGLWLQGWCQLACWYQVQLWLLWLWWGSWHHSQHNAMHLLLQKM